MCTELENVSISCDAYSPHGLSGCNKIKKLKVDTKEINASTLGWLSYSTNMYYIDPVEEFIVGKNVENIKSPKSQFFFNAFRNLKVIRIEGYTPPLIDNVDNSKYELITTTDNAGKVLNASKWKDFKNVYVEKDGKRYVPVFNVTGEKGLDVMSYDKHSQVFSPPVFSNDSIYLLEKGHQIAFRIKGADFYFRDKFHSDSYANQSFRIFNISDYFRLNRFFFYPYEQIQSIELTTAGTLLDRIGIENANSVKWLVLSGPINGTDLLVLKRMENLQYLDLSYAKIVDGGMTYYENNTTKEDCIGSHFLEGLSNLQVLCLPNKAQIVEYNAIYNCSCEVLMLKGGPLIKSTFNTCPSLLTVHVGSSVEKVATEAFPQSDLSVIVVDNADTDLEFPGTFSSVRIVHIGRNVKWLYFKDAKKLTDVSINSSVSEIGNDMFRGCSALTSILLPQELTTIGDYAFSNCSGLTAVCSANPTPPNIKSTTFDEATEKSATLYVPIGSRTAYWLHQYWGNFYNIVETNDFETVLGVESPVIGVPSIQTGKVYNLSGQLVKTIHDNQSVETQLPAGIYIINGKKVVVR